MSVKAMEWVRSITVGKSSQKAVLVALCNFHHHTNNMCDPSVSTLVSFTELNKKTVLSAIRALCDSGLIKAYKRFGTSTKYTLAFNETGPKNGTSSNPDTSSNFGTGQKTDTRTDTRTESWIEPVPELEPVPKKVPVPKTDTDRYQKRTEPVPKLEHKRVNGNNGLKHIRHASKKTEPERFQKAARCMWEKIQPITNRPTEPNLDVWAKEIRLIVERDKQPIENVWKVFAWANRNPFWQSNILSPSKLRKQFDTLAVQMNQEAGHATNYKAAGQHQDTRRLSGAERTRRAREEAYERQRIAAGSSGVGRMDPN